MSSSEQAPEPTMDEILASIRKIISDDEPGESPQPEAAAPEQAATAEDGLTDDLANALNDTQGGPEAQQGLESQEDILDLTQVVEEPPRGDAQGGANEAAAAPQETQAAPGEPDINALLAEAGVQDTVTEPAPASQPSAEAPGGEDMGAAFAPGDESTAQSSEESSITEALSALDPQGTDAPAVQDAAMQEHEPAAASEAPDTSLETERPAQPVSEEPLIPPPPPIPDVAETAAESEAAPEAPVEEMAALSAALEDVAPEAEAAAVAEESPAEDRHAAQPTGESGTLEDSVKEMLRPMLREWLDDNMERIVKDEVASGGFKDD